MQSLITTTASQDQIPGMLPKLNGKISLLMLSSSRTPSAEILKELSDSRTTVYDVLPAFFNHDDPMITLGLSLVHLSHACT